MLFWLILRNPEYICMYMCIYIYVTYISMILKRPQPEPFPWLHHHCHLDLVAGSWRPRLVKWWKVRDTKNAGCNTMPYKHARYIQGISVMSTTSWVLSLGQWLKDSACQLRMLSGKQLLHFFLGWIRPLTWRSFCVARALSKLLQLTRLLIPDEAGYNKIQR